MKRHIQKTANGWWACSDGYYAYYARIFAGLFTLGVTCRRLDFGRGAQ